MRWNPGLLLILVCGFAGCTNLDDPPVWADFDYQVRCVRCVPLDTNKPPHNIAALDGDDGLKVTCSAENGEITLRVGYEDAEDAANSWGIQIERALVGDGTPGPGCTVTVQEGQSSYRGPCGADEPDEDTPCQVDLTKDDYRVTGSVFCANLPSRLGEKSVSRHVTKPGSDTDAFEVEVQNCEGL